MAYEKQIWTDVYGETPIEAERLNHMEQGIENANNKIVDDTVITDKTTNTYSARVIDGFNTYSTEEKQIGYWIDGKPLYRKVVSCGALPNTSTLRVPIERTMKIIKAEGFATNGNYTMPIPNPHATSSSVINIFVDYGLYEIGIETHSDRSSYTETYLTIEYTKTTD